jgi:hypothetical protein
VLREADLTDDEIADLTSRGVVGTGEGEGNEVRS